MSPDVEAQAGPQAVARADVGCEAWRDAARMQVWATPRHADFYDYAGHLSRTLRAMDDLAVVLARQVEAYPTGRRVFDDSRSVDPIVRLGMALECLHRLRSALLTADRETNSFWSAIGHIGVDPDPQDQDASEVTDPGW